MRTKKALSRVESNDFSTALRNCDSYAIRNSFEVMNFDANLVLGDDHRPLHHLLRATAKSEIPLGNVVDAANYLVTRGGDLNARSNDERARAPLHELALLAAEDSSRVEVMFQHLINLGAKPTALDGRFNSSLHLHCNRAAHPDVIRLICARGVPVNQLNEEGRTAMFGLGSGKFLALEELVSLGADVNAVDTKGRSVLMNYCAEDRIDMAIDLLQYRPDVDYCNPLDGRTSLHFAVNAKNSSQALKRILEVARDIDTPDRNGCTPLHAAAQPLYSKDSSPVLLVVAIEKVMSLVDAGADPHKTSDLQPVSVFRQIRSLKDKSHGLQLNALLARQHLRSNPSKAHPTLAPL